MKYSIMRKIIILGASRGLGQALFQKLYLQNPQAQFLLVSRKIETNSSLQNVDFLNQDFSKLPVEITFIDKIINFSATDIIYCAGGGPYGLYQDKKWSDHEWAFNVNFNYPAQLIHLILTNKNSYSSLRNLCFVGSQIAESSPDIKASSYAAAKHALKGLITTLQAENMKEQKHHLRIKLFSPGYIKTDLLPENSAPRLKNIALEASEVASQMFEFIDSDLELS